MFMTRFKELKRIELAIKNKDKKEILWSLEYCQSRLKIAQKKGHIKHWEKLIVVLNSKINGDN
jgi:hypothetical protein